MMEMLIVISIIGILSGISVISYKGYVDSAKRGSAVDFVEQLNNGLKEYEQMVKALSFAAQDPGTDEEKNIVELLQNKDPGDFGSPYFRPDWVPVASSDSETFRIRWNERTFELIEPGEGGTGLEIRHDGSDLTN